MITLTIAEIYDLAFLAGILKDDTMKPDEDAADMEITIGECPEGGLYHEVPETRTWHRYIAWFEEYPEEGSLGLGPDLKDPAKEKGGEG